MPPYLTTLCHTLPTTAEHLLFRQFVYALLLVVVYLVLFGPSLLEGLWGCPNNETTTVTIDNSSAVVVFRLVSFVGIFSNANWYHDELGRLCETTTTSLF
jgi:hypothetical protein